MNSTADMPTSPPVQADLLQLDAHVQACAAARGAAFAMRCWAERAHAVIAPRMITTLVAATGVIALLTLAA